MDTLLPSILVALCAFAVCTRQGLRAKRRLFPGPPSSPIFGNILQLPPKRLWIKLAELGKTYGPVYSLRLFTTPVLVVNSTEVARELMDVKSGLYANRPLPKMPELSGFHQGPVLEHDPDRLRLERKLLHTALQPKQIRQYRDAQEYHISVFLSNLVEDPKDFFRHIRHLSAGVAIEISHGYRVLGRNDAYVKEADAFGENFADATLPNNYIVDWLPFLAALPAWLPGMGWKTKAAEYQRQYYTLAEDGHRLVKEQIAKGTARPSLTYTALVESSPGQYPDDIVMFTATQVYTGGGDTSTSILSSFFLALVRNPEVLKKAHEEIDRVVGRDRLPTLDDRPNLPYVEAIIAEVARIRPPISLLPRLAAQDDVYRGHLIEKNSVVLLNFWAMMHDEALYPEPHAFKPERWLSMERNPNTYSLDTVFGFGRRICPGRFLAEEVLFTTVARVLATFDIAPAHGEDTNEPIIPPEVCTDGGITCPLPFPCMISPRSAHVEELVRGYQA
ncbi:cytochrome P450 [Ganoderma leucocontextum]|nr:cytochrome P450 [Ganoderma leucocontextum]